MLCMRVRSKQIVAILCFAFLANCDLSLDRTPLLLNLFLQLAQISNSTSATPNNQNPNQNPPPSPPSVVVSPPIFSPSPGNQTTLSNISMSTSTPGATIHYTLNGSPPTSNSQIYTTPLVNVWSLSGKTISAIAVLGTPPVPSSITSGIYSYLPIKTGKTNSITTGDDGNLQKGISRSYADNGDGTIRDLYTGLTWQKCSLGHSNIYTCAGSATTGNWTSANSYCSSLNLAGKTWRLPFRDELALLVDYGTSTYIGSYFPSSPNGSFWTASEMPSDSTKVQIVNFQFGSIQSSAKTSSNYTRCVSGPVKGYTANFLDNGDGTITDRATGLVWQKCSYGQTNPSVCTGSPNQDNWTNALSYCNTLNLASRTWRLPNANELNSIVDHTSINTVLLDTSFFPGTVSNPYWTSTTDTTGNSSFAVDFGNAMVQAFTTMSFNHYIRCVSDP